MKQTKGITLRSDSQYLNPLLNVEPDFWWNILDSNFYKSSHNFKLYSWDKVRVKLTALADIILRTFSASLIGSVVLPVDCHPKKIRETLEDRHIYESLADSGDPTLFFKAPPKGIKVKHSKPARPFFKPKNGICETLSFKSPFEPINPRICNNYLSHKANRIAYARYFRHNDGPRPTIFAIHGFVADYYWLNEWFFALPMFYKMGCDVILYTLPFHGPRQTKYSLFSGHGFFSGGITRANEAFAQSVYDFRILMNYLQDELGVQKMGVTGISLGGYTSATLANVEDRLSFVIPNVPVASIADVFLEWFPISTVVKLILNARNTTIKEVRHLLSVHCPLTYKPKIPKESMMIIGGAGDRLASPRHSKLLWEHWGRCKIHWFPGSHLLHLDRGRYLREIKQFLYDIDFIKRELYKK